MINTKKLVEMAKKGQKVAATIRTRRISFSRSHVSTDEKEFTTSVAHKGHFVVYTTAGSRFVVPLEYLNSPIFVELLRITEEEFGLSSNGPITLPFEALFMKYIVSMMQRCICRNVAKALTTCIAINQCSLSSFSTKGRWTKMFFSRDTRRAIEVSI